MSSKYTKSSRNIKTNGLVKKYKKSKNFQFIIAIIVVAVIAAVGVKIFNQSNAASYRFVPANQTSNPAPTPIINVGSWSWNNGPWNCISNTHCNMASEVTNTSNQWITVYCDYPTQVVALTHNGLITKQIYMQTSPGTIYNWEYIQLPPYQSTGLYNVALWTPSNLPYQWSVSNITFNCFF